MINEINNEVKKFKYKSSIEFLLTRIDALVHENFRKQTKVEFSLSHEIDYDPNERFAEQHVEFIRNHRNYRYLIEKFVQIRPQGTQELGKDSFQYLIALTDWILTFYSGSDALHYGMHPVRMNVNQDYLINIELDKENEEKERIYAEENAKIELGIIGNADDKIKSSLGTEDLINMLDQAFFLEKGFSFSAMINVLKVLTNWPFYDGSKKEKPFYSEKLEVIDKICLENIKGTNSQELKSIIDFLELESHKMLLITGSDVPCEDLPVWEHRKRFSRYAIKPLIKIDEQYCWGPYSARRAGLIWAGRPVEGTLPTEMPFLAIEEAVREQKKSIEDNLVKKAKEIICRYTDVDGRDKVSQKWSFKNEPPG